MMSRYIKDLKSIGLSPKIIHKDEEVTIIQVSQDRSFYAHPTNVNDRKVP